VNASKERQSLLQSIPAIHLGVERYVWLDFDQIALYLDPAGSIAGRSRLRAGDTRSGKVAPGRLHCFEPGGCHPVAIESDHEHPFGGVQAQVEGGRSADFGQRLYRGEAEVIGDLPVKLAG
jgi:hypothetical protein